MDSKQWNSLSKPRRTELLKQAGLSVALAQASWQALTSGERKKLSIGKGWHEAATEVSTRSTRKGIKKIAKRHHEVAIKKDTKELLDKPIQPEHNAPEHHRVVVKKEAGKALNKPMERKELIASKKLKEEKLSERRYKEWYDKGFAEAGKKSSIYTDVKSVEEDIEMVKESNRTPAPEVYAGIPNLSGLESLAKLEGIRDGLIAKAKKAQAKTTLKEKIAKLEADNWELVASDLTQSEFAKQSKALMQHGNKIRGLIDKEHKTFLLFMKPTGYDEAKRYKEERQAEATPQGIQLDADEEKFVRGIYKQAAEGATVKEFGTRLYVWRGDEAYATKHVTDSEYMALKAIIKGVHQLSRADALKNLKEGRAKEAKIAQEIEERRAREEPAPKESLSWMERAKELMPAIRRYKNGQTISETEENAIIKLYEDNGNPEMYEALTKERYEHLDRILRKKDQKERVNKLGKELEDKIREGAQTKKSSETESRHDPLVEILKKQRAKDEEERIKAAKSREKWIAEEKSKPKRKATKTPEIEFNTKGQTTKKEVKRELTKLSTAFSKKYVDKHRWQYPTREKMPDGTYTITWTETVQEELPIEGLLIRGLTKEQAEEFRKELKEKVKSIKYEISIREGAGGKYELYTQVPIDPKSIRGALTLFTKHFGEKQKHRTSIKKEHEPAPLLIEYKCRDEPPIKVPIEKLDEEIKKCKEEGDKNAELRWKEANINNPNIKH